MDLMLNFLQKLKVWNHQLAVYGDVLVLAIMVQLVVCCVCAE